MSQVFTELQRRRFPKQPEWVSGNIFIRANKGDKDELIDGHTHNFDHTTIVFKGRIRVKATHPNGNVVEQEVSAPGHLLIAADVTHEIRFLEDDSEFWCVYSHRDPQGRVSIEDTGWRTAYL